MKDQEETGYFPELTEKQIHFLKEFLIVVFNKRLCDIDNSLFFVEGKETEISFGAISLMRTQNLNIIVTCLKDELAKFVKNKDVIKGLFLILPLPHN